MELILVGIAALADIIGGYLTIIKRRLSRDTLLYFIALAAGFILSACILDRVPETMKENPRGALWILVGFMVIYLVENLFSTHAHTAEEVQTHIEKEGTFHEHSHSFVAQDVGCEYLIAPSASYAALLGLAIHAFFDGVAITAGFAVSNHTGALMFLAVIFHKIPEGFSISSLIMGAGGSKRGGVLSALILGIATFTGGVFAYLVGSSNTGLARALLTLATGSFLYIGASDLIPATNQGRNKISIIFVMFGILLFALSLYLLGVAGIHP